MSSGPLAHTDRWSALGLLGHVVHLSLIDTTLARGESGSELECWHLWFTHSVCGYVMQKARSDANPNRLDDQAKCHGQFGLPLTSLAAALETQVSPFCLEG